MHAAVGAEREDSQGFFQRQHVKLGHFGDMDVGPDVQTTPDVARNVAFPGLRHQRRDLKMPSAIVPFAGSPDINLLINHNHPTAAEITILGLQAFVFDPWLF
jgi:hypothetical protein